MATPARDDFYARGVDIGQAPMEGYDATQSRDYLAQDRAATLAGKTAVTRDTNAQASDREFILGRKQKSAAATDAAAEAFKAQNIDTAAPGVGNNATATPGATPTAPGAGAPPAGTQPSGTGIDASLGGLGSGQAAPAAPGAGVNTSTSGAPQPLSEPLQRAKIRKLQAYAEMVSGDFEKANKLDAEALSAQQEHIFNQGAALGSNSAAWDRASKLISAKDPSITISTDKNGAQRLTIVQPDGTATNKLLSETDKRNMMGAQALMEAGHVTAALGILAKVDTNLATEIHYRNELSGKTVADNNKGYGEVVTANAHMVQAQAMKERNELDRVKQSFGQPVKVLDSDNKPIWMQPTMKNGKIGWEKADLPDGAHFPNQKDVSFQKSANGVLATDTLSGKPLYRQDAEGNVVPIEPDPWAGKNGMVDQAKVADWQSKGVIRGLVHRDDGSVEFGYVNTKDPSGSKYTTPEEALAAGQAQQASSPNNRPWPVAGAGRGLTVPNQPRPQNPYDAASAEAQSDRSKNYRAAELSRATRQSKDQVRGLKVSPE